jgi:hypothetical protein
MKTVTYVLGTFVTLVPGPNTPFSKGEFSVQDFNPSLEKRGRGDFWRDSDGNYVANF